MKARIMVLLASAAVVLLGGLTVAAVAIDPSCPSGTYWNGGPTTRPSVAAGTIPIPTCTSYATHVAPSSGVVIPRYATYMDPHLAERLEIGITSLLVAAGPTGLALVRYQRGRGRASMPAASA